MAKKKTTKKMGNPYRVPSVGPAVVKGSKPLAKKPPKKKRK